MNTTFDHLSLPRESPEPSRRPVSLGFKAWMKKNKSIVAVVLLNVIALTSATVQVGIEQSKKRATVLMKKARPAAGSGTSSVTLTAEDIAAKGKPSFLSFDTLKSWTYAPGKSQIPETITRFNGKNVEMAGYMMPLGNGDITEFVLVPSLFGCCYGQPPAVNHVVVVKMAKDRSVKYFLDPIRVRGLFSCGETREDGNLVSLYQIVANEVTVK